MVNREFRNSVYNIIAVPLEKIVPSAYNLNSVVPPEVRLLYDSIEGDGYTMPVVCYCAKGSDKHVIIDGLHRWRVIRDYPDIHKRGEGTMPASIIDKLLSDCMASTTRHNRAHGIHDVDLANNTIKELHELGRSDAWISKRLEVDRDETLRSERTTGLATLFRDVKLGQTWLPRENAVPAEEASGSGKMHTPQEIINKFFDVK